MNLIIIEPVKTMLGKHTGEYRAKIKDTEFQAFSKTRDGANAELQKRFETHSRHHLARKYFRANSGEVICLYHTFNGWCYDVSTPGQEHPGVCIFSEGTTKEKAIEAIERHVAQYNQDFEKRSI